MGIKENSRAILVHAPADAVEAMQLPVLDVAKRLSGEFDYIHLFVKQHKELEAEFPRLKAHLAAKGMLWVSWPKGRQLGTNLTLPRVIETCYNFGLVESTCLRVDDVWTALKFTHPKKGKTYRNSYGKLPE